MDDLRDRVRAAMRDRGVRQQELARQSGLSQGHLSKVLGSLAMGRRTRERLQRWLSQPGRTGSEPIVPDDLLSISRMLKRHSDELATLSRRLGVAIGEDRG